MDLSYITGIVTMVTQVGMWQLQNSVMYTGHAIRDITLAAVNGGTTTLVSC